MQYNPFYYLENPELIHYEHVWVNYVKNGLLIETTMPKEIIESWARCKEKLVDPMMKAVPEVTTDPLELEKKIKNNLELLNISVPIMELLIGIVNEKNLSVQIVDCEGFILSNIRKEGLLAEGNQIYRIGQKTDEALIGTNSYDLAFRHRKPIEVVGAEHFCEIFQKKSVYASPVFNQEGDVVASVGMTVQSEQSNRYMLGMVTAMAKAIENEFQLRETHLQLLHQNEEQKNILDTVTDGIVYIDENNIITHANLEMSNMTGLKMENMIGKNIDIIQAHPKINTILSSILKGEKVDKIRINGRQKSYNCVITHQLIESKEGKATNHVLFFVKYEEIQELADKMSQENRAFFTFDDIIGKDKSILDAKELAEKGGGHNVRIIIQGESGTGKEMFAQAIHNSGTRKKGPFVAVDCGAIPSELLESELFGYEEGAYTGARKGGHRGKFEIANGGTLFLDEISNMPIDMQSKLLRVLQENRIIRIGGYIPIPVDVQVISATNQNLKSEVEKGHLREDLFYRLNTLYIHLPALRERKNDISLLVHHMISKNKSQFQKKIRGVDDEAMSILMSYDWPGNVRQLNNVLERMILISAKDILSADLIPEEIRSAVTCEVPKLLFNSEVESLESVTLKYVKNALENCDGNIKRTSELLGISRATVYRILHDDPRS